MSLHMSISITYIKKKIFGADLIWSKAAFRSLWYFWHTFSFLCTNSFPRLKFLHLRHLLLKLECVINIKHKKIVILPFLFLFSLWVNSTCNWLFFQNTVCNLKTFLIIIYFGIVKHEFKYFTVFILFQREKCNNKTIYFKYK